MDNLISNLLTSAPTGMWERIITGLEIGLGTFALSIIILTVIIKLIMSPIDFFNKRTSKKMTEMQMRIQPQIDAINKKYGKDEKIKNQKLGELYQREKINPMGSCLVMLLNLGLTLAIFITLLNGMNAMASYKIAYQYEKLQIAYVQEYSGKDEDYFWNADDVYTACLPYIEQIKGETDEVKQKANSKVAEAYNETKEGFLWVGNIWMADSPFKNSIPSYDEYATVARLSNDEKKSEERRATYDQIMSPLKETEGRTNGYFILAIICVAVTFLNQWLVTRKTNQNKKGFFAKWGMSIFMTLFMAYFTILYTTMFSLYMITSQIIGLALTPIIDLINKKIDEHQEKKKIPTDRLKRI